MPKQPKAVEEITVAEAARRLEISPRGVVKAITSGHLKARRSEIQVNAQAAWLIDAASVAAYATADRKPGRKKPSV